MTVSSMPQRRPSGRRSRIGAMSVLIAAIVVGAGCGDNDDGLDAAPEATTMTSSRSQGSGPVDPPTTGATTQSPAGDDPGAESSAPTPDRVIRERVIVTLDTSQVDAPDEVEQAAAEINRHIVGHGAIITVFPMTGQLLVEVDSEGRLLLTGHHLVTAIDADGPGETPDG